MSTNESETKLLTYKYESKEEIDEHVKFMESLGYECIGEVRKTSDSLEDDPTERKWCLDFRKIN